MSQQNSLHVSAHAAYILRHREGVTELTNDNGLTCTKTETPGWWYVRTVDGVQMHFQEMFTNWRLCTNFVETPIFLNGGWCYFGLGWDSFTRALEAAYAFSPFDDPRPPNYDKEVSPFRY